MGLFSNEENERRRREFHEFSDKLLVQHLFDIDQSFIKQMIELGCKTIVPKTKEEIRKFINDHPRANYKHKMGN